MVRARKAPAADVDDLVERARARLAAEGFVRVSALGPPPARPRVTAALRALGFEVAKSTVRRPLGEQLLDAVADGAFVPLTSLASLVRGATTLEVKKAAKELAAAGRIARVLRGNAEVIVPASAPVYSRDELVGRRRAVEGLAKLLARATKDNLTILQADLLEAMGEALPELARSAGRGAHASKAGGDIFGKLFAALDATRDEALGLSFIPSVMNHLRPQVGMDAARSSLLDAAERGLIELRPEGGLKRLSREELELCLPGPHGTRLSWARRLEGRTP